MNSSVYERMLEVFRQENAVLRNALWDEWQVAHSEYCTNQWPHMDGSGCRHPIPDVLLTVSAEASLWLHGLPDVRG